MALRKLKSRPAVLDAFRRSPIRMALALLGGIALALLLACGGGEPGSEMGGAEAAGEAAASAMDAPIIVAGVGFATPESVLHDTRADVYLVSNINGAPLEKDGNGFISRLSPDGRVMELKWIDGESEGVTLHAPKGMAISQGTLYVADIDCIRMFDAATGEARGETCPEGASFLNDVAAHPDEGVLFTDSGLDAAFSPTGSDGVYHLMGERIGTVAAGADLGAPNGVTVADGVAYVVTFMSGEVFTVDASATRTPVLQVEGGQFDGVEVLDDGRVLVSNWGTSCVHILDTDGGLTCAMPDLEAPADIGVDRERGRVLVPLFNADEVRILPLG